jgi:hypothetical protein
VKRKATQTSKCSYCCSVCWDWNGSVCVLCTNSLCSIQRWQFIWCNSGKLGGHFVCLTNTCITTWVVWMPNFLDYISATCCTVFSTSICSIYSGSRIGYTTTPHTQQLQDRIHYHTTHTQQLEDRIHYHTTHTQQLQDRIHYHTTHTTARGWDTLPHHTHNSSATKRRFPIWEDSLCGIVFKKSTTGYSPKIK